MVGLLGQVACWERRRALQSSKLKVIFLNISSILINYPERLSKLLFEYFMAFGVNISRTKCCTLLSNNASSVRIYLGNLCTLQQRKAEPELVSCESSGGTSVTRGGLAHKLKNIYWGLILSEKLAKSKVKLISLVFSEHVKPVWPSLMMPLPLMAVFYTWT